jgi:hypothetical protein
MGDYQIVAEDPAYPKGSRTYEVDEVAFTVAKRDCETKTLVQINDSRKPDETIFVPLDRIIKLRSPGAPAKKTALPKSKVFKP